MKTLVFSLFEDDRQLMQAFNLSAEFELGDVELHHFPDQESLIRIKSDVRDHEVILVSSLNQPDSKLLPMMFFVKTAKALGAKKVSLMAAYLAYMRQDAIFQTGEGVSSQYFAQLISLYFDALMTVDPHLHRYHSLTEIYTIPAKVISSAPAIAEWIMQYVQNPLIIGPDMESEQWVKDIAHRVKAPYAILEKTRLGDQSVVVTLPDLSFGTDKVIILLDDIISSGKTMIEAVKAAQKVLHAGKIICIGVHAVFAGNAYQDLLATQAEVVTCNTISHPSNQIDVSPLITATCKNA